MLRLGTTEAPVALARGPVWRVHHQSPLSQGRAASTVLGHPRPPPQGHGGLLLVWTIEAPPHWLGSSCALGPQRPPQRCRGRLVGFGIPEAPVAWAQGCSSSWDQLGPHRKGVGASLTFRRERSVRWGLLHFGRTEAPVPFARGPPSTSAQQAPLRKGLPNFWDPWHPCGIGTGGSLGCVSLRPCRLGTGASFVLGSSRAHCRGVQASFGVGSSSLRSLGPGGLLPFGTTEALPCWCVSPLCLRTNEASSARAREPPLLWNH